MQKTGERVDLSDSALADPLSLIPVCSGDDRGMIISHPILITLASIRNLSAGFVHVAFLHQTSTHVFFVRYDRYNPLRVPWPVRIGGCTKLVQNLGDLVRGNAIQIQPENLSYHLGLGWDDDQFPRLVFAKTEQAVGIDHDLAAQTFIAQCPLDIGSDGLAFFLCDPGQNGQHQLAFSMKGIDVLLFENNTHTNRSKFANDLQ